MEIEPPNVAIRCVHSGWGRICKVIPIFCVAITIAGTAFAKADTKVEQWGMFEASFQGPKDGNPFVDVDFSATFRQGAKKIEVTGFYDGDGVYRVRFMPDSIGEWNYETHSNRPELLGKTGRLLATTASPGDHGPVRVHDTYHFSYADGVPYRELGTTCYAWIHQDDALEEQTLRTLAASPFNKIRMCIFPKRYLYNTDEPVFYPYEGTPPDKWDFTRFNPAFFQHLEKRVGQLRDLNIQADLILFHPYDSDPGSNAPHWGFSRMGAENDDRYVRYVIARLGAYRNVWWSLANEWDFVGSQTVADWKRIGELVRNTDPYGHLCSIHNGAKLFDHSLPWITHVSLQSDRFEMTDKYRIQYKKPLVYDECKYEGNIAPDWGNITAERLVGNFWKAWIDGAYCGHGETYLDPKAVLWWSKGGVLHGQSPARLAFMKKIIDEAPAAGEPLRQNYVWGVEGEYYLFYFGDHQPAICAASLPADKRFKAEVIDTWAMTITPVPGECSGKTEIHLPTKPYQAVRLTKVP